MRIHASLNWDSIPVPNKMLVVYYHADYPCYRYVLTTERSSKGNLVSLERALDTLDPTVEREVLLSTTDPCLRGDMKVKMPDGDTMYVQMDHTDTTTIVAFRHYQEAATQTMQENLAQAVEGLRMAVTKWKHFMTSMSQ